MREISAQKRFDDLISSTNGHLKVIDTMVFPLGLNRPKRDFLIQVKGHEAFWADCKSAANTIFLEELANGPAGLFDRLKLRISSYWSDNDL